MAPISMHPARLAVFPALQTILTGKGSMSAKIRIYGQEATFCAGCWTCDDDALLAMLQSLVDPRDPHTQEVEQAHALYAAGRFGGAVLLEGGWLPADHPAPDLTLADIGRRGQKAGWLPWLKKR